MADDQVKATGRCECGAVRYRVQGPLRDVIDCHCGQCRRTHGHFAAYTQARREDFVLQEDQGLRWYRSSPGARRGFCSQCGASLFFDREEAAGIAIAAGTLNPPTGLRTVRHLFVADAGDYYTIEDDLEKFPGYTKW
jgi:hypothetical protein